MCICVMISNETKQKNLDGIIKSERFSSSRSVTKMLSYLVECSINNNPPTEYEIASNVFAKDSDFNPIPNFAAFFFSLLL